jgi:hypothetical protein
MVGRSAIAVGGQPTAIATKGTFISGQILLKGHIILYLKRYFFFLPQPSSEICWPLFENAGTRPGQTIAQGEQVFRGKEAL